GHKSSSTTHNILSRLREKGYIKNVGPRAIEILAPIDELQSESDLIANEISELLSRYDFPLEVLQDVQKRLEDSRDPGYVRKQVRYLRNVVNAGLTSNK